MIKQFALLDEFHTIRSQEFSSKFQDVHRLIKGALSRTNVNTFFTETSEGWAFGFVGDPGTENEKLQMQGIYCLTCGENKQPASTFTYPKSCTCVQIIDETQFFDFSLPIDANMEWDVEIDGHMEWDAMSAIITDTDYDSASDVTVNVAFDSAIDGETDAEDDETI